MNIIRLYNQNRKQIFIVLLIVGAIIFAIHFANYLVKNNNESEFSGQISGSSTSGATTTYEPQKSAISSSSVSDNIYKAHSELIDKFMKYCNEGNVNSAYELLSTNCKDVMFPTLEYFKNNYQKVIFSEDKIYWVKNWTGSTYKISITENILATGKSNNGAAIEDYYTIVSENGKSKLNINSFIGRTTLSKKSSNNSLEVEVIYKDTYMDYVIFTFEATNKTDKNISLDSGESTQNMYIVDNNNIKYMSSRNEISSANLRILPHSKKTLQLKYFLTNVSTRKIKSIFFKDIILDFNTYENYSKKEEYTGRTTIKIEL